LYKSAGRHLQEQVEQEVNSVENSLEAALKQLWEKAYSAATSINSLREEKNVMQLRVDDLEAALSRMQSELTKKNSEIEQLRHELERMQFESASNGLLDKEERLKIQEKVKTILEKINSHL
jgi:predicted  nucleic acid-binding Zn-ribbon protein